MAKSVLIIDTPSSCHDCFYYRDRGECWYSCIVNDIINYTIWPVISGRPDECPLIDCKEGVSDHSIIKALNSLEKENAA